MRLLRATAALLASGCVLAPIDITGKECPCDDGWACRKPENVCVEPPSCGSGEASVYCVPDGLVGFWRFSEGTGTITSDSSDSASGVFVGEPQWTEGSIGAGLSFDYANGVDYVKVGRTETLDTVYAGDYSVTCWARPESTPPGTGEADYRYALVMKPGWSAGLLYDSSSRFGMTHAATIDGTLQNITALSTAYFAPRVWYHLAGTVSQREGKVTLYVDGEPQASAEGAPGMEALLSYATANIHIGIHAEEEQTPFVHGAHATLDEVRIYARVLSEEEIALLAANR